MLPEFTCMNPRIILTRDVLPAPDGPIRPIKSPFSTENEILSMEVILDPG